jgi:acyl dehydratase
MSGTWVTVLEARPSRSKPDRGLLRSQVEVLDAEGAIVMTLLALNMLRRRPTDGRPSP